MISRVFKSIGTTWNRARLARGLHFAVAGVVFLFAVSCLHMPLGAANDEFTTTPAHHLYAEAALRSAENLPQASIEALIQAVEKNPRARFPRLRLAAAYLDMHKPQEAEDTLRPLVESESESPEVLRLRARIALERRDIAGATLHFERSLQYQPDNIRALQSLVVLYFEHLHDLEKTREISGRILQLDGKNIHALLYRAEACAFSGDIAEAAELYRRILRYYPRFADRLDELAQRLLQRGMRDEAATLYREGLRGNPASELLQRGFETLAGADATTATLEAYRSLSEENPTNTDLRRLYARRLEAAKQFDEAEAQYRRILDGHPGDIASLVAMAEIALHRGDIEESLRRFDAVLERHPTDPEVYSSVARLYLLRRETEKAERILLRALQLGPQNPTVLVLLADIAERSGDLDTAEGRLKSALDALPANPTLLGLLASFYARQERQAQAAEIIEQMIATRPRDLSLYSQLLSIYLGLDRRQSATQLLERGRETFDDAVEFNLLMAQTAFQRGESELAEEALARAMKKEPTRLDAARLRSANFLASGNGDRALETLLALNGKLSGSEDLFTWRTALAGVYAEMRKWDEAVLNFHVATELNPEDFPARGGYIEALIQAGKIEPATQALNETVRRFSEEKPLEVQLLRARALTLQKQFDRALGVLRPLAAEHPESSDVFFALGVVYSEMKDLDGAEEAYRKVIALDPGNATALNNLGYVFAQHGIKLDEARELVVKALELRPGAGFALDSLGWIYFQKGEIETAIEYLEKARGRSVGDAEIHEHLGDAYHKLGNLNKAREHYKEAQRLDPQNQQVQDKLRRLAP
jgi:tetratricopeptide (TPR) repeat protein